MTLTDAEKSEIRSIAIHLRDKCPEAQRLAETAITANTPIEDFRNQVIQRAFNTTPLKLGDPEIGMSEREANGYSIRAAILNAAENGGKVEGIYKEASDAVARLTHSESRGFFIPHDVMTRSIAGTRGMTVGTATGGGFLVATDTLGSSMIELLRNRTVLHELGVQTLSGLVGHVAIPKQTGGATAYWLPETGTVNDSQAIFGQLALTPHRLSSNVPYSKQLLAQASVDVESLIRTDIASALAIEKDRAAINGSGTAGEPLGIISTVGVGSVTYGGAPSWAKVVESETTVEVANTLPGPMGWIVSPATKGRWKTKLKDSVAGAGYLWERNTANEYPAFSTNQVPSDRTIFGRWSDYIVGEWAGIDVVVDPYTLKKSHQVEVCVTLLCDMGVRHATSFVVSTDSGAQA